MAAAVEGSRGIVKTGFLASKQTYWCALSTKDSSLYYFPSREATKPTGRIPLADAVSLRHICEPQAPAVAKRFGFRVSSAKGVDFALYEPNGDAQEMNLWLRLVHEFVGKQWELTTDEVREHGARFDRETASRKVQFMNGAAAREVFAPSELPPDTLGKIWALSDRGRDKQLDRKEFVLASALIRGKQKGWQLPGTLPDPLVWSIWEEERGRVELLRGPLGSTQSESSIQRPEMQARQISQAGQSAPAGGASASGNMEYSSMPNPDDVPGNPYGAQLVRGAAAVPPPAEGVGYKPVDGVPANFAVRRAASSGLAPASGLSPPTQGTRGVDRLGYGGLPTPPASQTGTPKAAAKSESHGYGHQTVAGQDGLSTYEVLPPGSQTVPAAQGAVSSYGGLPSPSIVQKGGTPTGSSPSSGYGPAMIPSQGKAEVASRWMECSAPDGRTFYHDTISKKSTWRRPHEEIEKQVSSDTTAAMNLPLPLDSAVTAKDVGSNIVLDAILDPAKCEFLRTFLSEEGTNADLLFYLDCATWNGQLPENKIALPSDVEKARAIFDTYLSSRKVAVPTLTSASAVEGQIQIGVSKSTKASIKKALRKAGIESKKPEPLPGNVFEEAMREVLDRLKSEQFPKFMKSMVYLNMFNSLASKAPYELPEALWDEFVLACDGGDDEGWQAEGNMKGVVVETKSYAGDPLVYVRGSAMLPLSPDDVYKFAASSDLRGQWDMLMLESRVLERLDERTVVFYIAYRPPKWASFMNNQDFVVLRTERQLDDGTILVLSRSVGHADAPERKGYNRGEMYCGGFCIRSAGPSKSSVIYVNQARMHGIPKWAEKKYILKRALILKKIRSFAEKQLKKEKKKGEQAAWRNPQLDVNRSQEGRVRERQASKTSRIQ